MTHNKTSIKGTCTMKIFNDCNNASTQKISEIEWTLDQCELEGRNLEFGVWKGHTINIAAKHKPDWDFDGFDSFEGLPTDWQFGHKFVPKKYFALHGLPKVEPNVRLWKGWFSDTIEEYKTKTLAKVLIPIAYLNIDSDLKSSCQLILDEFNSFIVPGTIIRCDEYCCWRSVGKEEDSPERIPRGKFTNWKTEGEYPAMLEWLKMKNRKVEMIGRNWHCSAIFKVLE